MNLRSNQTDKKASEAQPQADSGCSSASPNRRISLRKRVAFSVFATLCFFSILEVGFRCIEFFKPPQHVDYGLGFNRDSSVFAESSFSPGIMETQRSKRVSFVRQRFKREKPIGTFRIVALGGSSVNYLQPQLQAMARKLTEDFNGQYGKVEVINCGGFAYGSHRLVIVFREALEYEPDLLLLYTGHNEFEEVEQLQLAGVNRLGFDKAVSNSAIIRFFRDRKLEFDISRLEKEHNRRVLASNEPVSDSNFARAWSHPFTQNDVTERMQTYKHNLSLILSLAKEQQVPVIMGTVSSNLARPYLPQHSASVYERVYELWNQGKKEEGLRLANEILVQTAGRHQASNLENNILRELANEFSVPLVDVAAMVAAEEPHGVPGETMFDDHCHLNKSGREVWRSGYEPEIRKVLEQASK